MYPCSIQTLQADALFALTLQHSDDLSIIHIRRAIAMALDAYGAAGRVAQECRYENVSPAANESDRAPEMRPVVASRSVNFGIGMV